jgi:hypothetical protein
MKNLFARIFTTFTLVAACLPMLSQAQSKPTIKVNIPFEFTFGDKTFPAGDYLLMQPMGHFMVLRDSRGYSIAQLFTQRTSEQTPARATTLKFYTQGSQHILREVWEEHEKSGEQLPTSKSRVTIALHREEGNSTGGGQQ